MQRRNNYIILYYMYILRREQMKISVITMKQKYLKIDVEMRRIGINYEYTSLYEK